MTYHDEETTPEIPCFSMYELIYGKPPSDPQSQRTEVTQQSVSSEPQGTRPIPTPLSGLMAPRPRRRLRWWRRAK